MAAGVDTAVQEAIAFTIRIMRACIANDPKNMLRSADLGPDGFAHEVGAAAEARLSPLAWV